MREEFHGATIDGVWKGKLLYGWGTINANVWLPSLVELVGITGTEHPNAGTYKSAMQGLNVSVNDWTDANGGVQFTYFKQFNASGGGDKIWALCNQENAWIRSPYCGTSPHAWVIIETAIFDSATNSIATYSYAVHPAGSRKQVACHLLIPNERNPKQINSLLYQSFWIV